MKTIPDVKPWRVRVMDGKQEIDKFCIQTINRAMVKIIVGTMMPQYWGKTLKISRVRSIRGKFILTEGII